MIVMYSVYHLYRYLSRMYALDGISIAYARGRHSSRSFYYAREKRTQFVQFPITYEQQCRIFDTHCILLLVTITGDAKDGPIRS